MKFKKFSNLFLFLQFSSRIKELNAAIDEYVSDVTNVQRNDDLNIGSPCLAKLNDKWSRAKIKSFFGDENGSKVTVFFVDFGQTENLPIDDIISISYDLVNMYPYQVCTNIIFQFITQVSHKEKIV